MIKKALDEKYSYQIDEYNVVHLFRGEDDCQQYLTNPLFSAIFKIETLEKENTELKEQNRNLLESCEGATMMYKDLCKAKEIIKKYLSIGVGGKITQNYLDVTKEAEYLLKGTK